MATALTPLANITLGSATNSVTFSSISGSYRDLILVSFYGIASAGTSLVIQMNGDTAANYSFVSAYGNGSTAASGSGSSQNYAWVDYTGTWPSTPGANCISHFMDYSATDKHKTILSRHDTPSGANMYTEMNINRWANTATITSIKVFGNGGVNLAAGSTFALYGVAA